MIRVGRNLSRDGDASRVQALCWAEGRVYHDPINDECTPDLGCCNPDMLENEAWRWKTYNKLYCNEVRDA